MPNRCKKDPRKLLLVRKEMIKNTSLEARLNDERRTVSRNEQVNKKDK